MTRQQCPGAGFLLSALVSGMRRFYHLSQSSRASRKSLSSILSDLDLNAVLRLTRLNVNSLPVSHRGCLPRVSCLDSEHAPHSCRVYCVRFHRRQSATQDKRPAHEPQLKGFNSQSDLPTVPRRTPRTPSRLRFGSAPSSASVP